MCFHSSDKGGESGMTSSPGAGCGTCIVSYAGGAQQPCALQRLLPQQRIVQAASLEQAAALAVQAHAALSVIQLDTPDCAALRRICALAQQTESVVLLLVSAAAYDTVWPAAQRAGVCVMTQPMDDASLLQTLRNLLLLRRSMQSMQDRTEQLQLQLADLKRIQKAKALLMRQFGMSEAEAHRWIEKAAMDRCVKKREIAETVIRMYEI